ncbi:Rho termination factor N-terminal domain-containing protein [Micromonospora sp. NPDC047074]|uniref:Rho termination factor N-terminal domain-containing protein n=1 Tax=Micromonospora sp. NPDC047074 TaxID=3154339 RepID=UPI0033CC37CB
MTRRDVADLVAALLRGLSAADLDALAEGRARLAVVPVDPAPAAAPAVGRATVTPAGQQATATPAGRATATPAGQAAGHRPRSAGTRAARQPAPADPDRAKETLAAMSRRADGTAYLSGWTTRDLRALAASLELRGVAGLRKADLVDRIVDRTIGYRLASTAIRQL